MFIRQGSRFLFFFFFFLISISPAIGQGLAWESASGTNGWSAPMALYFDGGGITAVTTQSGQYRSTDDCDTWQRVDAGPPSPINTVLREGTTLYAGTRGGLYRGTISGDRWTLLCAEGESVLSVGIDGAVIFAGTESGRVFRSTDRGATWSGVYPAGFVSDVRSIAIRGRFVIFTKGTTDMQASTDEGEHWRAVDVGAFGNYGVNVAWRKGLLWAVTSNGSVITSNDSGAHWRATPSAIPDNNGIRNVLYDGDVIYAWSVVLAHRSVDGGATWEPVDWMRHGAYTCVERRGDTAYIGTTLGHVLRVRSAAPAEWVNIGFDGPCPPYIIVHHGALYAGETEGDLLRSTNGGDSWHVVGRYAPGHNNTYGLIASGGSIYAVDPNIVQRTRDDGATWDSISALNPKIGLRMTAAGSVVIVANGPDLLRSTDDGGTWSRTTYGPAGAGPASIAARGSMILVGTARHGIYRSIDDGATWTLVKEPGPEGAVGALAFDGSTACAVMSRGEFYRSTDVGATWFMPTPAPEIGLVEMFVTAPGMICGASRAWGLYAVCSRDAGLTWVTVGGDPRDPQGDVVSMATDSTRLFASNGVTIVRRSLATLAAPGGGAPASAVDGPSIAPNPAATSAVLRFRTERPGGYRLSIVDALGSEQQIAAAPTAEPGEHAETIATGRLSAGAYRVVIRSFEGVRTVPLVVVR